MIRPLFLIDGRMEKIILQKMHIDSPIRILDVNSKNTRISTIAERVIILRNSYSKRCDYIIIIFDREGRTDSSKKIISELKTELLNRGIKDRLLIAVADRMIENWILADWDSFKKNVRVNKKNPSPPFEGRNGKSIIKQFLPTYQETTDGVELFLDSKASEMKKNSQSFNNFISLIEPLGCECRWLKR
jgi:hypothetical protein